MEMKWKSEKELVCVCVVVVCEEKCEGGRRKKKEGHAT